MELEYSVQVDGVTRAQFAYFGDAVNYAGAEKWHLHRGTVIRIVNGISIDDFAVRDPDDVRNAALFAASADMLAFLRDLKERNGRPGPGANDVILSGKYSQRLDAILDRIETTDTQASEED